METIGVPADDRFQVISQPGGRLVYDPQDLGVSRDHGIVTIQVTQVTQVTLACRRPVAKNETLLPADRGAARRMTGVEPRNVFVGLVEVGREDWSFGEGVAQYAMADRAAAGS